MDHRVADLLQLLKLEQLEVNLFRGESRDIGSPQVFGGQVLGQGLVAASRTVEGRVVNSLHAYFLRRGDFNAPIVYQVDRSRDGHSFSSRRVVAIQHGAPILTMSASFQVPEEGLEHQIDMPEVSSPESVAPQNFADREFQKRPRDEVRQRYEAARPFEMRPVLPPYFGVRGERLPPVKQLWFRLLDRAPDDEALHRCLLAYVSDYHLISAAILPHGVGLEGMQVASIDHVIWFHRSVRVDDWLLYSIESPSASGARGFARASIFTRDGRLVASTAQEGLIRQREPFKPVSPR